MRVDARHLGRDVRTQAEHTPRHLVDHFEGLQFQIMTGAGQEGFEILDMRGDDQVIPPAGEQIQQLPTGCFGTRRLFRQHFFDPVRQEPAINSRHFQNLYYVKGKGLSTHPSGSDISRQYPPACSATRQPAVAGHSYRSLQPAFVSTGGEPERASNLPEPAPDTVPRPDSAT